MNKKKYCEKSRTLSSLVQFVFLRESKVTWDDSSRASYGVWVITQIIWLKQHLLCLYIWQITHAVWCSSPTSPLHELWTTPKFHPSNSKCLCHQVVSSWHPLLNLRLLFSIIPLVRFGSSWRSVRGLYIKNIFIAKGVKNYLFMFWKCLVNRRSYFKGITWCHM